MATKQITITSDVTVNVTTTVQTFAVTFDFQKGYNNMTKYSVTWTSGGLGEAPFNITDKTAAFTYEAVPYGATYTVTYTRSTGGALTQTGTITEATTINYPQASGGGEEPYNDYDDSCGCGSE